jgi:23S rRNA pseudouridine1911/1915/1917 synthase
MFEYIDVPFVVLESEDYYAVFKPSGMHSVPVNANRESCDLVSWLSAEIPSHRLAQDPREGGTKAPGSIQEAEREDYLSRRMVNELGMLSRLDRDTSGIVLFARSRHVFFSTLELQRHGKLRKYYRIAATPGTGDLAGSKPLRFMLPGLQASDFSSGKVGYAISVIESRFRSYGEKAARVACVAPEFAEEKKKPLSPGLYATSLCPLGISSIAEFAGRGIAMDVEAMITSGFRHQIRAHMAWIGYPVAGDRLYGGIAASRLYLESHRIEIPVPGSGPQIFELYNSQGYEAEYPWK